MKKILQLTINTISYVVILVLLVIALPQNSMASCNSLTSHADQALCQSTVSQYGIENVELWQGSRIAFFSTIIAEDRPKLIVMERELSGEGQDVSSIANVQAGKLFLQEVDRPSKLPVLSEGTLIRLKKQSDKSRTRMLVLIPKSELRESIGSGANSTMSMEDNQEASGVSTFTIVLPSFIVIMTQVVGWLWTYINIWDVYYYNGGGAEKLSTTRLVATAFCTFGLNLIPHFIIYKIKKPRAVADPV